jgi:hypothetical protein
MYPSFWTDTVDVEQAELVDDVDGSNYGDQTLDWENATTTTLDGLHVQPVAEGEQLAAGRDAVVTRWRLQMPADVAASLPAGELRATDRVVYRGKTYDIDGQPEAWPSPSGTMDHVDAFLVLTEG